MALTPDRITQLIQQADSLAPKEGSIFRALVKLTEAEVSAQYTALIRQLVEALEVTASDVCQAAHHKKRDRHGNGDACPVQARHDAAITAARSRLLDSDLAKLTARGVKAWTGIDAQDLRDGGKP